MAGMSIKKGDLVRVIAGDRDDRGKTAEVIAVNVEKQTVTVQGINLVKRHRREQQTANGRKIEGGIITVEAPIHVSNVQLVVKVDGKEVVTRVRHDRVEVTKRRPDGSEYKTTRSVRIAVKTGKEI